MRSLARLTTLFRTISSLAVVSGSVAACSSSTPPKADREGLSANLCEGSTFSPLNGLTPKVPVDYLELREAQGTVAPPAASTGTPCATATNAKKCKASLAALVPTGGFRSGQISGVAIVYTRKDEVGAVTTAAELTAFLSFSTARDAATLAWANGHDLVCSENNAGPTATGFALLTRTGGGCGASDDINEHRVTVSKAGEFAVVDTALITAGNPNCAVGRRPERLGSCERPHEESLGAWFAEIAHLEAASIIAFERLALELRLLGAPEELVTIAEESAADEVRHAETTAALARRFEGVVARPCVPDVAPRSLFEVARENAVEGCVRETFGALVATYQGDHAVDADIREAMGVIARDETRHSALAWEIAAWAEPLLSASERAQIAEARRVAAAQLRCELHAEAPVGARELAGAPAARDAVAMFDATAAELWGAGALPLLEESIALEGRAACALQGPLTRLLDDR